MRCAMAELYSEFFEMLQLAKELYDSVSPEKLSDLFSYLTLDYDLCYELAYNAMALFFDFTYEDYNEDYEFTTWVFGDPCIDKFCRLCQEYEEKHGLSEEKNPYRQEIAAIIREGFEFSSYSDNFTWYFSAKERGRKRLVLFCGMEFCDLTSVPLGLAEIRDGFDRLNWRMENDLGIKGKVLQMPVAGTERAGKEAA